MSSPNKSKESDQQIRHRINAGRVAVESQIHFFKDQIGRVASEWKEDNTRVTFADFAISEKIIAALRHDFPQDIFCSEESNPEDEVLTLDTPFCWILDPIDGTNNYAAGYPVCCIALALLLNGTPLYGFIYDATRDLIIEGGPEHGALEKKRRLRPDFSQTSMDHKATVGLHFPLKPDELTAFAPLLTTHRIRAIGSSALATSYVANGFLDGVIDARVKVWDIAAAYAILLGAKAEFHFMEGPVFPLKTFHVRMPSCPYYAGSPAFCRYVETLLDSSPKSTVPSLSNL